MTMAKLNNMDDSNMLHRWFATACSFGLMALVILCALPLQALAQEAAPTAAQARPEQVYEYNLGPGDRVRVIVFGEQDLSGEFVVSGEGKVSLPLIGEIQASGATSSVLQTRIADALKQGYLNTPRVNVEVLTFRPFYIFGEVNKPGEYPYVNGMTIERAVAIASGYTYRANKKKVFIKHANETKEVDVSLSSPIMIQPGDTIRVAERYF